MVVQTCALPICVRERRDGLLLPLADHGELHDVELPSQLFAAANLRDHRHLAILTRFRGHRTLTGRRCDAPPGFSLISRGRCHPGNPGQFGGGKNRLFPILALRIAVDELIGMAARRSEEHTSELQSLMRISYALFCLKKKKINKLMKTNKL